MRILPDPCSLDAAFHEGIRYLERHAIDDARRNVEWMLQEILHAGRAVLYAYPERLLEARQANALTAMLVRRAAHEPLQYILGHADFFGLRLRVAPAVLIPRPETERLVELALEAIAGHAAPRVIDLGTGSGCIALALAAHRPDAHITGTDLSLEALDLAAINAREAGVEVTWLRHDLLRDPFPGHGYDLIVSNPPYIPLEDAASMDPEVRDHEPHQALFAGEDPLVFYNAITRALPALTPGGTVLVEGYSDLLGEVARAFTEAGGAETTILNDWSGRPRFVRCRRW